MQDTIKTIRGTCFPEKNIKEENKKLCDKYPFLNCDGDPLYVGYSEDCGPGYSYTWEDEVPEGWRKAFCPAMWDELKAILEKADYVDKLKFTQIKEKFGALRLYYSWVPTEIYDKIAAWEAKYEELSKKTCIQCGKPADYMSTGWISPWCSDCAKEINDMVIKIDDAEAFYATPREERAKFIVKLKK